MMDYRSNKQQYGSIKVRKRDCSRGTIVGPSLRGLEYVSHIRADCKKLSCPHCGPKKARAYRKAIGEAAETYKLTRLMTLTLDPAKIDIPDSVAFLRECFNKFRVYLRRKNGKSISYIAIVEEQKNGRAHMHCLIGIYLDQKWISQAWQGVGGGRIVDIRIVDVRRIQAYLSKYLTKDFMLSVSPGKKRISTSRDIKLFFKRKSDGWSWKKDHIDDCYFSAPGEGIVRSVERDLTGIRSFLVWLPLGLREAESQNPIPVNVLRVRFDPRQIRFNQKVPYAMYRY
jgi:hypothetical protein